MKKILAYMLAMVMVLSCFVLAAPVASAAGTPVIAAVDTDQITYLASNSQPNRVYRNYSTGENADIASIYGSFDFTNLQVTKPNARAVDVYATWYAEDNSVISFVKCNATITSWSIDVNSEHYWWISGHVDWFDTTTIPLTNLGQYRLALVGKVYDTGYPSSNYHYIDYTGSLTLHLISDQTFTPNYPTSPSLYAVSNQSSVWGLTGTNSFNGSEYVNWAYGGVGYSYLWTTIGYDIGYYGSLTWYGPHGATDYHSISGLAHTYEIARIEHQSNILIGGLNFSEAVDFQFDNGYGNYVMVFEGKVYDSRYSDAQGHYITWRYTVTISYLDPTVPAGPGSNDPGGDPTGSGGQAIEPIVIQGFAATGGLMMPLGVMAGVWLWRKGNMMGGISTLILMPLIGAGLLFAMLN